MVGMKLIDYQGKRIGILTILAPTGAFKYKKKSKVYLCKCDCGNTKELSTAEFSSVKSCGYLRAKQKENFKTMNLNKIPSWTLPNGESSQNALFKRYQKSAKKRGYLFNLTLKDFKKFIKEPCFYCNQPPSQKLQHKHRPKAQIIYTGIDRKDNNQGYILNNCVSCCKVCNRAKDVMTETEFFNWVNRVYQKSIHS